MPRHCVSVPLPRIGEDPSRMIDFIGLGPEAPNDTAAERRFFSED